MKLLADEHIPQDIIAAIATAGFPIDSVREKFRGFKDIELIRLIENTDTILLTEDKDFGEWVFSYNIKSVSVIFLRYEKEDYAVIKKSLITLIHLLKEKESEKRFITITKNKVRIRLI